MSVKIRLQRQGRKNKPFYHIVVADSRSPRDGKYIERLGLFDTGTEPVTFRIDEEKAFQWMQKGAKPSDSIRTMLSNEGVMYKMHLYKGVAKGALKTEEADAKYKAWREEKQKQLISKLEGIKNETALKSKKRFEEETKKREEKAKKVFEKTARLAAEAEKAAAEAMKVKEQAVAAEAGATEIITEVPTVTHQHETIAATAEVQSNKPEPKAEVQVAAEAPIAEVNNPTESTPIEERKAE